MSEEDIIPTHFIEELRRLGMMDPGDITEFHQSLNDATREDLRELFFGHRKVFGLKAWEWEFVFEPEPDYSVEFLHTPVHFRNFSVDYVFRLEDLKKVEGMVKNFRRAERKNGYSGRRAFRIVKKLSELAIYRCVWV